ncbi:MAG: NADH-quinone oxidoreductase subunit M [Proteobacteria bacterium]|nr:NADH-quinone oxidoreductase subunit M [Pseudomonadota bacterium]
MDEFPILSAILLCPVAAFVVTLVIPGRQSGLIKGVHGIFALLSVVLSMVVWARYDTGWRENGDVDRFQMMEDVPWVPDLGIHYILAVDGISVVLTLLNAIVFLTGVLSMWTLTLRVKEYFLFMAALVFGVFGVFLSLDIFMFFFFYEVAVLPMYPLIAVWGSTRKEYSAMKLTLFLLAGSALLFPGLISLYFESGGQTWNMLILAQEGTFTPKFQVFVYPFLYLGFGVLAGMFPFHGWSPTGHVAAPTAVSMLHAGVLMKLGAFGILRIAIDLLPSGAAYWAETFAILATIGIVYGAFVAMRQTDFKYVIGFSSVSHMGIVLLGLNVFAAVGAGDGGSDGLNGAVFQMFAHGIMTALFFSSVGFIYDQTHDRDIRHFGGLIGQVPVAASFFLVAGLCGMGVPGFASFWAELLVFVGAVKVFTPLGVIAIAGLVFTAAYMMRVFGKAMFGPKNPQWDGLDDVGPWSALPRVVLVGVLVLFGFLPSVIVDVIRSAGVVSHSGGM